MELRLTFNTDAQMYDKFRPAYSDDLSAKIIQYSGLNGDKKALEIGIGTGQATLPFLKTGCNITAIEIGDELAQFTRGKFSDFLNFDVIKPK